MRDAEELEHRKVGLAVPTVRCRVDEHRAVRGPHEVAGPEVAVQPGGRVVGVEVSDVQPVGQHVHRRGV